MDGHVCTWQWYGLDYEMVPIPTTGSAGWKVMRFRELQRCDCGETRIVRLLDTPEDEPLPESGEAL